MIQGICPQRPRVNQCGQDPRMTNARAAAVANAGIRSGQCVDVFDSQREVVIEPAVMTAPNIINHHRRVEHIIPVITEDIHRFHNHVQFVVRPEPRMRQTFDSDVTIGRPLPAQPLMQQPMMQTPMMTQQALMPMEIDVIERFGVENFAPNWNGGFAQQAPVQAVPFNQTIGQMQQFGQVAEMGIGNPTFGQGFFG